MRSRRKQIHKASVEPAERVYTSLKESETRYRRLFETARDGILILDADTGQITDVNPFIVEMLGYTHGELIGKKLWEIGSFRDIGENLSAFQELQDKGYIRYEHLPLETKNRQQIDVEFVSNVYWVNHSRVIQCNIRDITERIQAEKAKSKRESQFQQARKTEAIATLAGGIAHQFNNALVVISGTLDLLEMDVSDNKNLAWYLGAMKKSALRMTQLTRQLLAYARGEKYQIETISLSDFVRDTLPLLTPGLNPSVNIETDLPDNVLKTNVDLIQMQMILPAIMSNASEAIEAEGCIRITCKNEVITEKNIKDFPGLMIGSYVCLTIEDNGKGMDEETRRQVFEPFFTTKFQGRGLDMAAVYGVVNNHGGRITVESQLNRGTIVRVWLPALFEIKEKATKKLQIRPNSFNNTIPTEKKYRGNDLHIRRKRSGSGWGR
ncbi:MAG: two-component system sensor histidine kinase NtrB [Planctomycetota bacterium]|jgi:PAS domain S-box-containing protein